MPVQVNMPAQKESALDKIAKGLGIAQSVFGIAGNAYTIGSGISEANARSQKAQETEQAQNDPNSEDAIAQRKRYTALKVPVPANATVSYMAKNLPKLADLEEAQFKHRLNPPAMKEQKGIEPDAGARLATAPADTKSKVGLMANALSSMTKFEAAFASGQRPAYFDSNTPLIGGLVSDTDLTQQGRLLDEAVGRLQSGGVIGGDELKTFTAMRPRPGDSPEIQAKKIADMRQFLEDRLTGFGFKPQELAAAGFDIKKMGYDDQSEKRREGLSAPLAQKSGMISEAVASQGKASFTPEDVDAFKWAKANSKDPRAAEILKQLQSKGLR